MTSVPPEFTSVVAYAHAAKNKAVLKSDGNMRHAVDFERDGKLIARVSTRHVSSDELFLLANRGIVGFAADTVTLIMDTVTHIGETPEKTMTNPYTGEPWDIGEMEKRIREDAAVERGILHEGVQISQYHRAGGGQGLLLKYRHDRKKQTLKWFDPEFYTLDEIGCVDRLDTVIAEAFAMPTVFEACVATLGHPPDDMDPEEFQRQMDVTFCLRLSQLGFRMVQGAKGKGLIGADDLP